MSGYHEEHNLPATSAATTTNTAPRPDVNSFLTQYDNHTTHNNNNPHAHATRTDTAALFAATLDLYRPLLHDAPTSPVLLAGRSDIGAASPPESLLLILMRELAAEAADPPPEVRGVSDEFLADLDRVPLHSPALATNPAAECPICSTPFAADPHALVVRLPCHAAHLFDYECVAPWLKMRGTCPLDRVDFAKRAAEARAARAAEAAAAAAAANADAQRVGNAEVEVEVEEEDDHGMYG